MANIFEFLSKDGNITPEKVRKSRQMQFRDKTAYVWGLCYRWDPSLSRIPDPRIPHFMPPWYLVYSSFYLSLSLLFKLLECPFLFRLVSLNDHLSCLFNPPSLSSSSYSSYSVSSWRTSSGFRVALIVPACQPGWEEMENLWKFERK